MASIRIPFPENDEPAVVALTGARITIGRLPFNTVQIIDRTMSGFHAELILEDGHYRLHDRGSMNGTFINGEPATDFHLREACKISFGTVECDFDPQAEAAQAESVPTRGEMHAVRQENAELRGMLAAVREEVAALLAAQPADAGAEAGGREEFMQVVAEREALKTAQLRQEQEVVRLKGEVAVLRRDRENLQRAWDATKAELGKVQRPVQAVAVMELAPAVPMRGVPAPAAPVPVATPAAPVPVAAPAVPVPTSRPMMPVAKPVVPLAPPTGRPFPAPKPGLPTVKLAPAPMPVATAQPRPANTGGVRPLPKPVLPGTPTSAKVPVPANALPKPVSGLHPRASVMAVHAPTAGPKGTQRIG